MGKGSPGHYKYDGIYIHIKGLMNRHTMEISKKKEIIEIIDKFFFNLLTGLDINNTIVAVTADHSTVCAIKAHSGDLSHYWSRAVTLNPMARLVFRKRLSGSIGELCGEIFCPSL